MKKLTQIDGLLIQAKIGCLSIAQTTELINQHFECKCPDCTNGLIDKGNGDVCDCPTCKGSGTTKLKTRSDEIDLLIEYTNWLLGEGYVDTDVYDEAPTAIDMFMKLRDKL